MVSNLTKEQIAIGLLVGVIALTFFTFIGTIAEKFVSEKIRELPQKSKDFFGSIFVIGFIVILILTSIILIRIILAPTDLHLLGNMLRKLLGIKT
jgi:energy-coupling factor transporter transmembrane protein EcfT